ncbi:MAG: hypothetical protein AB1405_06610 [Bdellovibrionota bacterium]
MPDRKEKSSWLSRLLPRRGNVLEVKLGYNPNSSSIGADLTPIVLFSGFLALVVPSLILYLKTRTPKGAGEPVGGSSSSSSG